MRRPMRHPQAAAPAAVAHGRLQASSETSFGKGSDPVRRRRPHPRPQPPPPQLLPRCCWLGRPSHPASWPARSPAPPSPLASRSRSHTAAPAPPPQPPQPWRPGTPPAPPIPPAQQPPHPPRGPASRRAHQSGGQARCAALPPRSWPSLSPPLPRRARDAPLPPLHPAASPWPCRAAWHRGRTEGPSGRAPH